MEYLASNTEAFGASRDLTGEGFRREDAYEVDRP